MGGKQKTAIYLRISVEDAHFKPEKRQQGENSDSIDHQRAYLLDYISKDDRLAGNEIVEFCDDGFTGTNMDRPGMQELLKQVRQNRIGCILVKDLSRFSRDYIEAGTYLNQLFPFMGVDFIAVGDGYDSRKQEGMTLAFDTAFQTLIYDLYSKDISVKVKASFDSKCAAGEYVFGQVPFGYEKSREIKNMVVVNEREAKIVRFIFSLAADGMTTTQIAKRLFEKQVPTAMQLRCPARHPARANHTWSSSMIRNILDNRFYLGEMSYGKSRRKSVGSKGRIAVPKSDWKVIANHHEPLVSPEVFARVALAAPGHSTKRKRDKHPLVGKIYCGGCGYSLNYKPQRGKMPGHFWCAKHSLLQIPDCCTYFPASLLEETILMLLSRELIRRGDQIRQHEDLEQFRARTQERLAGMCRDYRKQYHTMEKERDSLYESYAFGRMDAQGYRSRVDRLTVQIKGLAERIKEVEREHERIAEEASQNEQDMKQIIRHSHLEELTQEVVDTFIKRIEVYKGRRVEIAWDFTE